jgi:hypothetical protein
MHPSIPAVDTGQEEVHLKHDIGVEPGLVKDVAVQGGPGDPHGPVQDVFSRRQPDTRERCDNGGGFNLIETPRTWPPCSVIPDRPCLARSAPATRGFLSPPRNAPQGLLAIFVTKSSGRYSMNILELESPFITPLCPRVNQITVRNQRAKVRRHPRREWPRDATRTEAQA